MKNTLPSGMTMDKDGKIWWSFADKKDSYLYCLDDEKIIYMTEKKKKSVLRAIFEEAVNMSAAYGDNINFMDEPFPDDGCSPTVTINGKEYYNHPIKFNCLKSIKENRKKNIICLIGTYSWDIRLTGDQYDFFLNYILSHCPDIKKKVTIQTP